MTASVVDERCVVGKRIRWRQTGGDDSVAAASRRVTRCDSGVAMMAAAEVTTAVDKKGTATADGTDKRCLGGGSA